ncbi:MAG: 5-guanidino-2-oxopentanoate decarboxylase [Steroidobacteraceae bacterium]|jgi:5-guanidino-2-oxopentanoate decarboxylase
MNPGQNAHTIGVYLAELLAINGIDTVFGIPGVHTLELYRGLAATGLRHVLVRHEQGAGFAADGYARLSGRPAAAMVISGPGLTNILTAVGQAYSDSVPMLVIASTPVRASLGKGWGVLHELADQRRVAEGVFGTARTAHSADDVRDHLRAALLGFRTRRARPAYLEIPLDLLAETTTAVAHRFDFDCALPQPDPVLIERAAARLHSARRPLIIAGGGARGAATELRALAEQLDAYVATSAAGKGLLPETHPLHLGASLPYHDTQALVAAADVVLAIGTELSETDIYTATRLNIPGELIRIDIDPIKLTDQYGATLALLADAAPALRQLARALPERTGLRRLGDTAQTHRPDILRQADAPTRARAIALAAIRAALPPHSALFTDMTQIAYLGNYAYPCEQRGSWFHPSGYGTLGWALPAALGAKLAAPAQAVAALAGDFGVQFSWSELATAVELKLALPVIVWNNQSLGQIRDDMLGASIPPTGVSALNPDLCAYAAACGAHSVRVNSPAALTAAIRQALLAERPTLIEAAEADFLH